MKQNNLERKLISTPPDSFFVFSEAVIETWSLVENIFEMVASIVFNILVYDVHHFRNIKRAVLIAIFRLEQDQR